MDQQLQPPFCCRPPQTMDDEGFLLTGDIAELTPCGALRIIDRRKQLLKLVQGEYVAPERVEAALRGCGLVEAVWVHGEPGKRRLVAVVVPREDRWGGRDAAVGCRCCCRLAWVHAAAPGSSSEGRGREAGPLRGAASAS
jgi:acyl-CoA synthetase (AMP-forming)/AMP-acid ligase II